MGNPVYKDEVFNTNGGLGCRSVDQARREGYKWITDFAGRICTVKGYTEQTYLDCRIGIKYSELKDRTMGNKYPKPKDRSEILEIEALSNGTGVSQARAAGYKFYRYISGYEKHRVYWIDEDGLGMHTTNWDEVPVGKTFEEKVMEFVLDPKRSNRHGLMRILTDYSFFVDGADQPKVIEKILVSTDHGLCEAGKKKFRDHMGDLLPKSTKRVITLTVEGYDYGYESVPDWQRIIRDGYETRHAKYGGWDSFKDVKVTSVKNEVVNL